MTDSRGLWGRMPRGPFGKRPFTASVPLGQEDWVLGCPEALDASLTRFPRIIAVGGGKGGVGKSLVSANLATKLAESGKRVLALDLDIGGANLHTYFGLTNPKVSMADVLLFGQKSFQEAIVKTGIAGCDIISGGRDEVWTNGQGFDARSKSKIWELVHAARNELAYDVVLLDLGAGTHRDTVSFFTAAHLGLLTVLPEPTSIENAYMFVRSTLFRLVDNVGVRTGQVQAAKAVKTLLSSASSDGRKLTCAERLTAAASHYPEFVAAVHATLRGRRIGIVMNQVRSQRDIDIGPSMELVMKRYFGFDAQNLGCLNYDDAAWKSLRNRRLLVVDFPHSTLSRRFDELSRLVQLNLDIGRSPWKSK